MITKVLKRIDFALLVTILITLISVWMYLYNTILDFTDLAKFELAFGLSICHYLLTYYVIIGLFICYFKGKSMVCDIRESFILTKWQIIKNKFFIIFFDSWIYLVIFSIATITIGQLIITDDLFMLLYLVIILLLFLLIVLKYTKNIRCYNRIIIVIIFTASNIFLYFLFLLFMTISSMQLKFETNKDYYTSEDKFIIAKVDTRGYIFKPYYNLKCSNDKFPQLIYGFNDCFQISTKDIETSISTLIPVIYYNSLMNKYIKIKKIAYIKIYFCPPGSNYYHNIEYE